jgi:uncharacterized protein
MLGAVTGDTAMPTELGYLTIPVPSVPRAKAFFAALFGWDFEQSFGPQSAHINNTRLPMGFSTGDATDYRHLYFQVPDLAAAIETLTSLGGRAEAVRDAPTGLSSVCTDDQGTRFSLWQPTPGYET